MTDPDDRRRPGGWPAGVRARAVALSAGGARAFCEEDWAGALVVVAAGEIELECLAGGRRRFRQGSVIWLKGLGLRAIHDRGATPAVLLAISRRDR